MPHLPWSPIFIPVELLILTPKCRLSHDTQPSFTQYEKYRVRSYQPNQLVIQKEKLKCLSNCWFLFFRNWHVTLGLIRLPSGQNMLNWSVRYLWRIQNNILGPDKKYAQKDGICQATRPDELPIAGFTEPIANSLAYRTTCRPFLQL